MQLSSNETAWAVMIVTVVVSCAFGALMTWLTIKAKHAKDIAEVQDAVKNIIARLVLLSSNLVALFFLLQEISSSAPIDRKSVLIIVWSVCILVITFLFSIIMKFTKSLLKSIELHGDSIQMTGKLSETVRNIVESLPCSKPSNSDNHQCRERKR